MSIKINQNIFSMLVQRNLGRASQQLEQSFERLSSGQRVNRSADDPAAMAGSEQIRYNIQSLRQNQQNVSGAVSMVGTAESHITGMVSISQRLRELAVQGANDTLNHENRQTIQNEISELLAELESTATTAQFAGRRLFDGSFAAVSIQVGASSGETIPLTLADLRTAQLGDDGAGLAGISVMDHDSATAAIKTIDAALSQLGDSRSRLGAVQNRLESLGDTLAHQVQDLLQSDSRLRDTDFAFETARLTQAQILQDAAISMLSQANVAPRRALELLQ